jgi:small neutral amino acid transporter SnatA (MarC family)
MGIPLSSFQLAGSVVLFLIGLKMIFGELHQPGSASAPEPEHDRPCSHWRSRASPGPARC